MSGTALLAGRRGLVLGVSGENGVGYHAARAFRAAGAEVTVSHRESRRAAVAPLADALGCERIELDLATKARSRAASKSSANATESSIFCCTRSFTFPPVCSKGRP